MVEDKKPRFIECNSNEKCITVFGSGVNEIANELQEYGFKWNRFRHEWYFYCVSLEKMLELVNELREKFELELNARFILD